MTAAVTLDHVVRWILQFFSLEGGLHEYMTLHAHFNPLPSQRRPKDAFMRSGGCEKLFRQGINRRLPWCSAYFQFEGCYR